VKKVIALSLALGFVALSPAYGQGAPDNDARYQKLIGELRCLVCQNQTIADSNAPLAADLREQVKAQIGAGRSDAEIVDYLTARYGDFVRYRPAFKAQTWLLWLGPFGLLLVAALAAALFMRRSRATPAPVADPAAVQRLLDEGKR
jgi:cytochrome c-type biogenesis protein CcmH